MSQLIKKFIGNDQVDETKVLLNNNAAIRAKNDVGSPVELLKLNASNELEALLLPKYSGSSLATQTYVGSAISAAAYTADGNGIELSGQQFALELDGSTLSKSATGLKVADLGIADAQISASAAVSLSKLAALTANKALASDASGVIVATSVTDTELGYLSGVSSAVQTQIDSKLALAGGTMTGAIAMGNNKITGLANGTNANDAVNLAQLQATAAGVNWKNPVLDPDLIDDSLSTPPVSPNTDRTYIVGTSATGAWVGLEGRAVFWNGSAWVDLLGRVVAIGDRFGVSMEHGSGEEGGGLVGQHNKIAQITDATVGAIVYSFYTPVDQDAVFVNGVNSPHFGHSYTYIASSTSWIEFGGISALTAGIGLSISGNVLSVNLGAGISQLPSDEVGIDLYSASGLHLTEDGTNDSTGTAAQLSVKLDGATLVKSANGLKVASVTAAELGYLSGVTSSIQTQLDGKASTTLNNLGTTSINAGLIPDLDISRDLGSPTKRWFRVWANDFRDAANNSALIISNTVRLLVNTSGTNVLNFAGTDLDVNTRKIINVVNPTAAQDVATKNYVDTLGAGYANTTLSNLTSPTAINQHLLPSGSRDLGSGSAFWANAYISSIYLGGSHQVIRTTSPSGKTIGAIYNYDTAPTTSNVVGVMTANNNFADGSVTGNIHLETGNKLQAGSTGNSGDISLITGSVAGSGTRGKIYLNASAVDVVSAKIVNLAAGTALTDAVNKGQMDADGSIVFTTTSGGSLILSDSSAQNNVFTGSSNHTLKLPDPSTMVVGKSYETTNRSTGDITITDHLDNVLLVLKPNNRAQNKVRSTTGTPAYWGVSSWPIYNNTSAFLDLGGKLISNLATPVSNSDAATKEYVDLAITSGGAIDKHEEITLSAGDITNEYFALAQNPKSADGIIVIVSGIVQRLGIDFSLTSNNHINFGDGGDAGLTNSDLDPTSGNSALAAGDKVYVYYRY